MTQRVFNHCILLFLSFSFIKIVPKPYQPPHFYRAAYFLGEPILDHDGISSFEVNIAGGTARKGYNHANHIVPFLDIYGPSQGQQWGTGVPGKDRNNPLDLLLINLSQQVSPPSFGAISFPAHFSLFEVAFAYTQSLVAGLFFQLNFPFSYYTIDRLRLCDLTSSQGYPNNQSPLWQEFLSNFDAILGRYGIAVETPLKRTFFNDLSFLAGWTHSYTDIDIIDFFDLSVKMGIIAPLHKSCDTHALFALPTGYDGHWAFPFILDTAFGSYEWLVLGLHLSALVFLDTNNCIRARTSTMQEGSIYLPLIPARVSREPLWNICGYIKADHALHLISLLFGYTFTSQEGSTPSVKNPSISSTALCRDPRFGAWRMHTIHGAIEFDFASNYSIVCPRVSFFYNYIVSGERIIKTNMIGGNAGIEFVWDC